MMPDLQLNDDIEVYNLKPNVNVRYIACTYTENENKNPVLTGLLHISRSRYHQTLSFNGFFDLPLVS
ncbi:hypothetical protein EDD68_101186 [Melghiribacillus thermohalophilus]|uniref:Uncharacterized protein n=1 Tax=Melghiribacillus thermohalophilus TaxID=1324956 RepID=A0A4R3NCX2_9BACI|nr:hypothetical protein EDD68_101186 [Melghiribacillus thermohalophilus]